MTESARHPTSTAVGPKRWYVTRVRARMESTVKRQLESLGTEVYLPLLSRSPWDSRPGKAPLFQGYLFVRGALEELPIRAVSNTLGLVSFGGVTPWVPDDVVAALIERVSEINREDGRWQHFRAGDVVRVMLGATPSVAEVVADSKSPQAPVRLLVEFLGQLVHASVQPGRVQPALTEMLNFRDNRGHAPRRTRGRGRWIDGFGSRTPAKVGAAAR